MTTLLLTLFTLAAFAWAVIASCWAIESRNHADADHARADRAAKFAEDCLTENRDLRRMVRKWRGWATQLEQHILDERQAPEAAFGQVTPVYRDVALEWLDESTEWTS